MMQFPCTSCGVCCLDIRHIPDLVELGFPDETGRCRHLEGKQCGIYAERPTACRIDEMKPTTVGEETWHLINMVACDHLHRKHYGV